MNVYEFLCEAEYLKVVIRATKNYQLHVKGNLTRELERAASELKQELLEFACIECGVIDKDVSYDENMQPFCVKHYHRIGLLWCEVCEERTKLTSMSDCLVCVAQQVIEETLAS